MPTARAAALERDGTTILSYGTGGGYGPLREVLAAQHGVAANRVFVTTGGLQGFVFYAAAQLAQRPGRVLVEGPTYDRPLKILARDGAEVVPIAMDDEGLDLDALEAELKRGGEISFLYTIPTFQNPSGRTLGTDRRRRLVELAAQYDLPILEDDPYGRVRYDGEPVPSIHELEGGERVTFTSSFSKTVAPGLRIGYFVVPEGLVAAYDDRAVSTYISPSLLPQATVFELIDRGAFGPNLDRVRGLLKVRKDAMLSALAAEMPAGTSWSSPRGRLLPLARLRGRRRRGCAADASDRSGGHLRAGLGLLPERFCRPLVGAACVQLRDARAHRRGRRAARLVAVGAMRDGAPRLRRRGASLTGGVAGVAGDASRRYRAAAHRPYGISRRRLRRSRTSSKSQPARKPSPIARSRTTKSDASVLKKTKLTATALRLASTRIRTYAAMTARMIRRGVHGLRRFAPSSVGLVDMPVR